LTITIKNIDLQKNYELTPKGPRPFSAKKTLKTAISVAKSKKN